MKGVDAAFPLSAHIPALKAGGIEFAARYYSYNMGKNLSPLEAKALSDAGIMLVSVFEARGDEYDTFTAAQGQKDCAQALILAKQCGQPEGSAIYFAVDFDASDIQLAHGIGAYFDAVKTGLVGKHELGAYGSGLVLSRLNSMGLVTKMWLAQSRGWQGTKTFTGAHIVQGPSNTSLLNGDPVDTDEGDDFGGWGLGNVTVSRPTDGDIGLTITTLQTQLQALGYYRGKADGIAGPQTIAAINAYEQAG